MNSKRLAMAILSVSFLLASINAVPAQSQFLKKLLQGGSQQNEFQTNQFGQPYQNNSGLGFGNQFFGGQQPFSGGQQFSGGYPNAYRGGYQRGSSANLSSSLNSLESNADQVSNRLQKFLQSTGRWAPQPKGNDMQCCVAMQAFKQQLGQVKRNAGSNVTPQFQMQLNQLQQSANNLVNTMQVAGIDPGTRGQAQVLRDNVSQILAMSSITAGGNPINPFWNGGGGYPGNYGSPMLHVNQSGRGQLTVMGQQYMRFRDVSLETIDPVSRRVRASFSGVRDGVILSGPITQQTMNGITIAVDSSDKGSVNGVLNIGFVSNGSIGSINSTGQMNGQGYAIQFNGQ
ncbi:MAG: hypothetical protein IT342_27530 [Candidatus Melainabacteria bacterium]|nr:hypothetical protein [Candidatus Melainabacteria bacterium]